MRLVYGILRPCPGRRRRQGCRGTVVPCRRLPDATKEPIVTDENKVHHPQLEVTLQLSQMQEGVVAGLALGPSFSADPPAECGGGVVQLQLRPTGTAAQRLKDEHQRRTTLASVKDLPQWMPPRRDQRSWATATPGIATAGSRNANRRRWQDEHQRRADRRATLLGPPSPSSQTTRTPVPATTVGGKAACRVLLGEKQSAIGIDRILTVRVLV